MSVEISIHEWSNVDLDELAHLTLKARKASPFWNQEHTLELFHRYISQGKERFSPSFVTLARSAGQLLGWLCVIMEDPLLYELWRWHPIVSPGDIETEIAENLIHAITVHAKSKDVHNMEVCFDFRRDMLSLEFDQYFSNYKTWFEKFGFIRMDETVYMTCRTTEIKAHPQIELVPGVEIREYHLSDKKEVFDCYYRAFKVGKDRSFLNKTEDQRKELFEKYVADDGSINQKASLILVKDQQIIGFSIVNTRPEIGDEHFGLLGIHPDYQGKGMGKQLLSTSMSRVAQQGEKTMSLGVDLSNKPAYALYEGLGFTTQTKLITYAWKEE